KPLKPEIREEPRQIAEQAARRGLEKRAARRGLVPESVGGERMQGRDSIAPPVLTHAINWPRGAVGPHGSGQRVLSRASSADSQNPSTLVPDEPRKGRLTDAERR